MRRLRLAARVAAVLVAVTGLTSLPAPASADPTTDDYLMIQIGSGQGFARLDPATGAVQPLRAAHDVYTGGWSIDGRYFAYRFWAGNGWQVGVYDADAQADLGIVVDGAYESWTPDHRVVYAPPGAPAGTYRALDVPTRATTPYSFGTPTYSTLHRWSPDGGSLAYVSNDGQGNVFVAVRDAGGTRSVAPVAGTQRIAWSSTGRLVFDAINQARGRYEVSIADPGAAPVNVTADLPYQAGNPTISPDGRTVVYTSNDDQGSLSPYRRAVPDGTPVRLSTDYLLDQQWRPGPVPAETVLVLLPGISQLAVPIPWVEPAARAREVFGQLLTHLGCDRPVQANALLQACDPATRSRLSWSPYSFRGVDAQDRPRHFADADTHVSLDVLAPYLNGQVAAIRRAKPGARVIFLGYSEGGTVAARWVSTHHSTDTPVVALHAPLFGYWPENRGTPLSAEDHARYCGDSKPFALPAPPAAHHAVCRAWIIPTSGFRSAVSYDWRAERVFQPTGGYPGVESLPLLTAGNRDDLVAPVWWTVSPRAAGVRVVSCGIATNYGHDCLNRRTTVTQPVFDAIRSVVDASLAASGPLDRAAAAQAFGASDTPSQFGGISTTIQVPAGARVRSVAEYGTGDGPAVGQLTCVLRPEGQPRSVQVTSQRWAPRALVVRWRQGGNQFDYVSQVRVVPYGTTTAFTANVSAGVRQTTSDICF